VRGEATHFGLRENAGAFEAVIRSHVGGAWTETIIGTIVGTVLPAQLRMAADPDVPGGYLFEITTPGSGVMDNDSAGHVQSPTLAALVAVGPAVADAALDARFDDFLARTPQGDRPFAWFAYRDLDLPGTPDMVGARAVVQKLKPAHTHGAAITSLDVLCDDPATGCDREPLGGI
jgi:hypothetical protein